MDNNLLQIKFKQRLNKLASNDFTNIECWQIAELVNKAQNQIVRRNLHGGNVYKEGDEQSVFRVDDFQKILLQKDIAGSNRDLFFETEDLPKNYLKFKRLSAMAYNKTCPDKRPIVITLREEANVDELLKDVLFKPSLKWADTFATIIDNKFRIYTNGEFSIKDCKLTYYRFPRPVSFEGCRDVNDEVGTDQTLEFNDSLVDIIIDEAVKIAAGDINDFNNLNRISQNIETNN